MADFSSLKQTIQAYIKQNGNEEITGNILQDVLLAMVSTLGDSAINSLASVLQDEITERQNQDGILQGNITAESTARQDADTALGGRINGLQTAINGINTKLAEGYIYAGIATPSTDPGIPSGKVFYIAVSSGTYTNFSNLTVAQGINILKYNGSAWSKDIVYVVDQRPKKASQNLVTSGGVFDNMGALDVSELNATENPHTLAQYADLSSALAAIPTDYQKGGMSIKFVQSSDNKYVQYRLMSDSFNTTIANWQGVDDEPTAGSNNLVKSGGVKNVEYKIDRGSNVLINLLDERCFPSKAWQGRNGKVSLVGATFDWFASGLIELTSDAKSNGFSITNTKCYTSGDFHIGYFLDENLGFISYIGTGSEGTATQNKITVQSNDIPNNAAYIVFNGDGSKDSSYCSFSHLKLKFLQLDEKVDAIENRQLLSFDDLCYPSKAWKLNGDGEVVLTGATNDWKASGLVILTDDAISNGFTVTNLYRYTSANFYAGFFLDKDLKYLGTFGGTGTGSISICTVVSDDIPNKSKYIVFNGDSAKGESYCSFSVFKKKVSEAIVPDSADHLLKLTENPINVIKRDTGFTSMFLNWGFIGDSLASGAYNCKLHGEDTFHNFYEFSWGQFILRLTGAEGYNYTYGGQTAHGWINDYGPADLRWEKAQTEPRTSYIIHLGHNDVGAIGEDYPIGTVADINLNDYTQNANSFIGDYAGIIQRLRSIQPNVPIFCGTLYNGWGYPNDMSGINNAIKAVVAQFEHVYVIDFDQYFPSIRYGGDWANRYRNSAHFTAQGYLYVAWAMMSYIDYIVRNNWQAFKNQALIGTDYTL